MLMMYSCTTHRSTGTVAIVTPQDSTGAIDHAVCILNKHPSNECPFNLFVIVSALILARRPLALGFF